MTYHIKDTVLTQEEFDELWAILGEHKRICRDQVTRWVKTGYQSTNDITANNRLKLSEDLIYKLITDVKIKNTYTK